MQINCGICKKEFYAKPSHVAKGHSKYCSKNCFDIWQRDNKKLGEKSQRWNSLERICKVCNKKFFESPSRVADGRGIYCSKSCYSTGIKNTPRSKMNEKTRLKLRQQRIGKLNPAYIDGRSFESRQYLNYGDSWNVLLREKVIAKYGKKCSKCYTTEKTIHIHHLDRDTKNHDIENLIPVCIHCHKSLHPMGK